ncbi:MAG: alpha/beta hydrolase [Chitinophagaceae bacterium]|nr:alpha/beta hydrolase [Chitinophagaceae bacterium]
MKLSIQVLGFITLLMFIAAGCKKENGNDINPDMPLAEISIIDTAYGTDQQQKMDIYLPAGRNDRTKTIVLIHGGGWTGGSKADLTVAIPEIKKYFPGYAIANINYRLASNGTTHLFPAQENDVKAAINFLAENSDEFHIAKDMVLTGFSAGAHLALLHGYKNDPEKYIKAIVDFFGPTDLTVFGNLSAVQQLILLSVTGKSYEADPEIYAQSSPVKFITAQSPPTIVLQGGADPLVPPSQADLLIEKLQENNVIHQLVFYPGEAHGWTGDNLLDSFAKIKAFLEANVE